MIVISISCFIYYWDIPSFSRSTFDVPVWQGVVYINPFMRFPEFLIGILSARLLPYIKSSILLAHFLVGDLFLPTKFKHLFLQFFLALLFLYFGLSGCQLQLIPLPIKLCLDQIVSALSFSCLICLIIKSESIIFSFLNFKPFIFLGEMSFGIYLFHQPLMISSAQAGGVSFLGLQLLPLSLPIIFIWTLVIALVNHIFVEKPLLSLASR